MGSRLIDLTGQRFGRLIALERVGSNKQGSAQWLCQCDCANKTIAAAPNLKVGNVKSCGCLRKDNQIIKTGKKTCASCGQIKALSKFNKSKAAISGFNSSCKECKREIQRQFYHTKSKVVKTKDQEKHLLRMKWYIRELKDCYIKSRLYTTYGISASKASKELVNLKREQIMVFRALKQLKEVLNE